MASLKSQLFQQYANDGLRTLISECQLKYEPKKEDRFNYNGITYEIGNAQATEEGIEFEISSKIPQEELSSRVTLKDYFQAIREILTGTRIRPKAIDMENITRELGGNERKERDYVKLKYSYKDVDLYDKEKIRKRAEELSGRQGSGDIPNIPGVTSLLGKLILLNVRESIYNKAKENMQDLIDANEAVRKKLIWGRKR